MIQHADDTNIYKSSSKANAIPTIRTFENDISEHLKWSKNNSLVFNSDKLKSIVFSSRKANNDKSFLIRSKGKSIQQEPTGKLLGVTIDQHLTWNEQINIVTKSNYNSLRIFKKFKRFTPWNVQKSLTESLIIYKWITLWLCIANISKMPKYLQSRSQRLQNCTAGYVLWQYANTFDVIKLNWLPVAENTEFNASKLAYQGLHNKTGLNICQLNRLNGEEILDRASWDQWLTIVKIILSSNRIMKFLIRYQLILEYVNIKNLLSTRLDVFIRIMSWLGYCYCPYKVFSFFFFFLVYLRFSFN